MENITLEELKSQYQYMINDMSNHKLLNRDVANRLRKLADFIEDDNEYNVFDFDYHKDNGIGNMIDCRVTLSLPWGG